MKGAGSRAAPTFSIFIKFLTSSSLISVQAKLGFTGAVPYGGIPGSGVAVKDLAISVGFFIFKNQAKK
jgi:hypothetical protein